MSFGIGLLISFNNCTQLRSAENSQSVPSVLVPMNFSMSPEFTLSVEPGELEAGSHVKFFGIFPTTTLSHESVDADRFKMMLQELQGRTNMISILYISDQALALAHSKGLVSQRVQSAFALFEEKIAAAESLGFSVAVELTPAFFDFDANTLRYDLRKFKNDYLSEWAQVSAIIKRHSKVNWFYPFDEPYWNAKSANISYAKMKNYLDQMNSLVKSDFPNSKIVFIEAFAVMNENFDIPVQADYVGMDCYGNFDNCYGESIPSYYNKLAARMTDSQKFIIIPDAFDFKGGDENGLWQNNVIKQSKKFLAFSRENSRVEAIIFFLYNSPLDKNLNVENLASTRQGSLLNLFFDQVSLQNVSVIGHSSVLSPNVNITYLDHTSSVVNIQTTDLNSQISISPSGLFDMSFSRPLMAINTLRCTVFDPDGLSQNCDELSYRQARYNAKELKKGQWIFKFELSRGNIVERRINLIAPPATDHILPPVGYLLIYYNINGSALGTCSFRDPESNGNISGNCQLNNTPFSADGNVGSADPVNGTYLVNLSGEVSGIHFTSLVNYDPSKKSGSGSWSASDGATGAISVVPVR